MERPLRIIRIAILLLLLLPVAAAVFSSDSSPSPLREQYGRISVPSGRTTEVEVDFRLKGSHPILNPTTVEALGTDSVHVMLLTREFDALHRGMHWTLEAAVTPQGSVMHRTEEIELVFRSGSTTFPESLEIPGTPIPWFWPTVGLSLGLLAVIIFILVFRIVSGGE